MTHAWRWMALTLAVAAGTAASVRANTIRTFAACESFELSAVNDPLVGTNGWYGGDPLALVVRATTGTPAASRVFPAATHNRHAQFNGQATMPLENTDGNDRGYTEFLVRPVLGDQPGIATTNFLDWVLYFNPQGRLVLKHGNFDWDATPDPNYPFITQWTEFSHTPVSTSSWVRIRITVDFTSMEFFLEGKYWYYPTMQVSLNGNPLIHPRGLASPTPGFPIPPTGGSWFFCLDADNPDHDDPDYGYRDPACVSGFGMQGYGEVDDVFIHSSTNVPSHTLTLTSTYAGAKGMPAVPGATSYPYGTPVACSITNSPAVIGATQMVCIGWTNGTGTVAPTGTNKNVSVVMNADSGLTWNWKTLYRLTTAAGAGGTVSPTPGGWYDKGLSVQVTATPEEGKSFRGWTGDVPAAQTNQNPLTLTMDRGRSVTALFTAQPQYTTKGIPLSWLAIYGITNNQETAQNDDPDHDGAETWAEYVAGTIPTSSNSVFELLSVDRVGGLNRVRWYGTTNSGVTNGFGMYLSTNLQTWSLLVPGGTLPRAANGTNVWTDPTPSAGPAHYRPMIPWEP